MASKRKRKPRASARRKPSAPRRPPRESPGGTLESERRGGERRHHGIIYRMPLFRGVPLPDIETALAGSPVRDFQAEAVLLRPGEANQNVYVVLEGNVRVHLDHSDSPHAFHIGPGEPIGEMSIIDGVPASAYAVAEPGCRVLVIDQDRFWSKVVAHPRAIRNLLGLLTERTRRNDRVVLKGMQDRLMLEHIEKELRLAREIQQGMLPKAAVVAPLAGRVDLHATIEPARAVGGDLYDFFVTPAGGLCFLIGDVSDKGVPAALFMARTVDITRVITRLSAAGGGGEPEPASILAQANRELCENNESGMFVTLFLAMLDPRSGRVSYCNAGHCLPYLCTAAGRILPLSGQASVPLGVHREAAYHSGSVALGDKDALFLYSDGVTEAENRTGELFGERRLEDALRAVACESAEAINAGVVRAVREFTATDIPSDDLTTLALRFTA